MRSILVSTLALVSFTLGRPSTLKAATWKSLATIPSPRQEHSTVSLKDHIYIVAGVFADFSTTGHVDVYNPKTNTWADPPPAPVPVGLNHPNVAVVNDKIYVLGGLAVDATGSWSAVNNSFVYDPRTNKWTDLPPFPADAIPRGSAAMGVHEDTIYLAGGMRQLVLMEGGLQDTVSTVTTFNVRTGKWATGLPDMPAARDHAGAAVIDNVLYVVGGRDHGQPNVRGTVFTLDLATCHSSPSKATWVIRNTTMPTPRGGLCAAAVDETIYTFGGEGNLAAESGVFPQVEAYNTRTNKWTQLENMPNPRHGTSATTVRGKIYIPGGGDLIGGHPMVINEVFSL
ncbi:hypothetical protein BKA62DRAFT_618529 [Auriculariales sp. MPI-PUGE-AT-0066]|nr:hypothetical protein BKA62DRAFT_618529 [Auriculariales sp. MPI-PUGE-AT-0066]